MSYTMCYSRQRPGDGIGIRVGLRSQILGVRVSSGAPNKWSSVMSAKETLEKAYGHIPKETTPSLDAFDLKIKLPSYIRWLFTKKMKGKKTK